MKQINHLRSQATLNVVAELHLHMHRQSVPVEALELIKNYINDIGHCSLSNSDVTELLWGTCPNPTLKTHGGTTEIWCTTDDKHSRSTIKIGHVEVAFTIE